MGVTLRVLDPTPACPASVVAQQSLGSFRDPDAVKEFAQSCDVLTVEIEHIDADAMEVRWRRGSVGCGVVWLRSGQGGVVYEGCRVACALRPAMACQARCASRRSAGTAT